MFEDKRNREIGLIAGILIGVLACGGSDDTGPTAPDAGPGDGSTPAAEPLWVLPAQSTVDVGATTQLAALAEDEAKTKVQAWPVIDPIDVTWTSSSPAVATVSATGLVTGVAAGTATITGTAADGGTRSAMITVDGVRAVWGQVATGGQSDCALTDDGRAFCWGLDGRRGDGAGPSNTMGMVPSPVVGGHAFTVLSAGDTHTCGVTAGGDAYCWGGNEDGQLGDGSTTHASEPMRVAGGHEFSTVSAGWRHTCGVTTDGEAYCWGSSLCDDRQCQDESDGRLGAGDVGQSSTPVLVAGGHEFASISVKGLSCGLTTAGDAYCWGTGLFGGLGNGRRGVLVGAGDHCAVVQCATEPTKVRASIQFTHLSVGANLICGLTTGGESYCWGGSGQPEMDSHNFDSPTRFFTGLTLSTQSSGNRVLCGAELDGRAHCIGLIATSSGGSLGDGLPDPEASEYSSPVQVVGGQAFVQLSMGAGAERACGVTGEGRIFCWGESWLDDGTDVSLLLPIQVADP